MEGTDYFADRARHPENERVADAFVFRCDGPLLFFNVDYVRDRFFELLAQRGEGVKLAVLFLGTTPAIDLAGAELVADLHNTLKDRGIAFHLAEAHGSVRDALERAGFGDHGGKVEANQTVAAVLRLWSEKASPTIAATTARANYKH